MTEPPSDKTIHLAKSGPEVIAAARQVIEAARGLRLLEADDG